ncbi:hypothetical protein [uncultured Wocania sp.]|uniref:hypothetical protein n=1 Tax=uncultured Wocania sp. TaxID=2834404 RepID=UPI0030F57320
MRKRNEKGQFVKSKVSEFGFVNLSTYTSPEVKEVNGADWIEYGADNDYFQYLIDRYNGSPTNNAAINGISQAIYGKGLNATDSSKKPNEYAQMVSLFRKDVVRRLCYDLKLMGQCAIQVIYSKDRSKIAQLEHMPIETLRAEKCDEDGNVPAYYYYNDWPNIKKTDEPLRIPAFGMSNENIEIYYIKPYKSGFYYYSPVDYQGGLQYAELEEEVSNYHLNNILNGLAPSMLINFNNGTPNQQERQLIETKIAQKFSGTSNAGKFILAFNDNKESQAEITPVQLSDAHNQYQFLSEESTQKIMVAHRIVSPMLLGIKDGSGLGNNAEEIKTASLLMDNTVIRPFQELLIDCFDNILAYNEISLNLYFTTLQPLEFTEVDQALQDKETIEEETGVEMQKFNLKKIGGKTAYKTKEEAERVAEEIGCGGYHEHEIEGVTYYMPCVSHEELKAPCWDGYEQIGTKMKDGKEVPNCVPLEKEFLSDEMGAAILENLKGETLSSEWELVDELDTDNNITDEEWATLCIKEKKSLFRKFADEITAKPNGFSYLDSKNYKIRYKYAVGSTKQMKGNNESRPFCKSMMSLSKAGVVYRLEGIDAASKAGVNSSLGHNGKPYDLFKFKGGVYCRHKWKKVLYRLKSNTKPSEYLNDYKKTRTIPESYNKKPRGTKQSEIAPVNMPKQGAY